MCLLYFIEQISDRLHTFFILLRENVILLSINLSYVLDITFLKHTLKQISGWSMKKRTSSSKCMPFIVTLSSLEILRFDLVLCQFVHISPKVNNKVHTDFYTLTWQPGVLR